MSYDISALVNRYNAVLREITIEFETFFRDIDFSVEQRIIKRHTITLPGDLAHVLAGRGFYLIATDLPIESNSCSLRIGNGLPVVYRGQGYHVRERLESHLFYDLYRAKGSTQGYTVCMRLNGNNVNVDKPPFNKHQWVVATHSMPASIRPIREAVEEAFDNVFGRPVGSSR
jgi:hypothetical protein